MALEIQTGRTLTITINSVDRSIQTAEVTLTPNQSVEQYVTLSGSAAVSGPTTWELRVRGFQDWGEASSFAEAMFSAAATGTPISWELETAGGSFTGNLIPVYPNVGGSADAAMELDLTFQVDGAVTFTAS
jgi:hypothetical protein